MIKCIIYTSLQSHLLLRLFSGWPDEFSYLGHDAYYTKETVRTG